MLKLLLVLALTLAPLPAGAQLYRWTDKDGTIHFTNDPSKRPKEPADSVETIKRPAPTEERPKWERKGRESDEQKGRKGPASGKD